MKNSINITFFILFLIILVFKVYTQNQNNIEIYYLSALLLFLGFSFYPSETKLNSIIDFMIIPIIVLMLFNLINIFFIHYYTNIYKINLLIGLFCFLQFFHFKTKEKIC